MRGWLGRLFGRRPGGHAQTAAVLAELRRQEREADATAARLRRARATGNPVRDRLIGAPPPPSWGDAAADEGDGR